MTPDVNWLIQNLSPQQFAAIVKHHRGYTEICNCKNLSRGLWQFETMIAGRLVRKLERVSVFLGDIELTQVKIREVA